MHTVFALLCFIVVINWLIFPYPSGLLHWHCGNLTIAPVPAKQPWWIWINTSCEFIMNDCINTTKQSTTKPCAYFLGYTVQWHIVVNKKDRVWRPTGIYTWSLVIFLSIQCFICMHIGQILFVDDINLPSNGKYLTCLESTTNSEFPQISWWRKVNKSSLNIKKTQYMIFCRLENISTYFICRFVFRVSID